MCGIPAKKSRDHLDNSFLIDVTGIPWRILAEDQPAPKPEPAKP
jgi:hypothetical protein